MFGVFDLNFEPLGAGSTSGTSRCVSHQEAMFAN